MDFSWDESKRRRVLRDHNLDFEDVKRAFDGPRIEDYDPDHSQSETRWRMIGMLYGEVIVISYTLRGSVIHLITARRAEPEEEQLYFEEFFGELR